jgi:signal transduction histidine kinase/CheY-like chemotaxis protein
MLLHPLPPSDEATELRACLRDLVGLLGLPALWGGRDARAMVRLLAETLVEALSLNACWVCTANLPQEKSFGYLYTNGGEVDTTQVAEWSTFTGPGSPRHQDLQLSLESTPAGELRIARFSLAYYGHQGQVTVGSTRDDFPKPTELILLRSAASLAASGLRTAQLVYERERAMHAKDQFLAMLGHELRNPMAPIVSALDLMKIRAGGSLTVEQKIIERQVTHLIGLVDDLMDVTRITRGKIELKHELLDVRTILDVAIETAQPLIQQRQHQLSCDAPAGLLVKGDARRLAQVVSNLVINSAKYTDPCGRIAIMAARDGNRVVIKVKDNGIGIDGALIPHIFDLFEQGFVDMDRSRGGLGIGLSVVKALVTMHGGTVTPESAGKGLGSTFTVALPLAQAETSARGEVPRHGPLSPERGMRILVVDDNRDAADILGELLRTLGHEVHVVYSPLEALTFCEQTRLDTVILDIGLPEISGYELAAKIRARLQAETPRLIAVTGYGQKQDQARSRQAGIDAHLTKPVSLAVLASHLQIPKQQ